MGQSQPRAKKAQGRPSLGFALLLLFLASGCASVQAQLHPRPVPGIDCPAIVFVADGAGDFQIASRTLRAVVAADAYPLRIETCHWSHGYGRVIADQVCYSYARSEGKRLAEDILAYSAQHPTTPVYVLGHSAGSTVVIAALEELPPGVVDRAVLLSPSLSSCYDLHTALASVRRGIHVFYSQHDYWYLGFLTGVLGTTDRRWIESSGRYGFEVPPPSGQDRGLYSKLYQRGWHPADVHLGNFGGHYGNYQPEFLRAHVIPLLQPASPPAH